MCESLDILDVVVSNADVLRNTNEEAGATEITIAVNVTGTFLLALNVFPDPETAKDRDKKLYYA